MLDLKDIYKDYKSYLNKDIEIQGWIKNHRKQKEFGFIDFNDGTFFNSIQIVYTNKLNNFNDIKEEDVLECYVMEEVKR